MKQRFLAGIVFVALSLVISGALFCSGVIQSAEAAEQDKPLLIIRFNRPGVEYKQPVKHVVERIIETKADAQITVLSVVPVFDDEDKTTSSRQIAEHNAKKVASAVEAAGVEADKVKITYRDDRDVPMNEIHLLAK